MTVAHVEVARIVWLGGRVHGSDPSRQGGLSTPTGPGQGPFRTLADDRCQLMKFPHRSGRIRREKSLFFPRAL
jgi:hypothetical protein